MNTQIYTRLIWQIPILVMLVALLMPDFPWVSSAIGAWPVWLLSLPFATFVRHAFSNIVPREVNHSMKSAQVFVFPRTYPANQSRRLRQKRAA